MDGRNDTFNRPHRKHHTAAQAALRLGAGLPRRPRLIHHRMRRGRNLYADGRAMSDEVNHPPHYTAHPSGVECIVIVEHMNFCLGNAVKYIWRAEGKGDALTDLKKARWYLDREIARIEQPDAQLNARTK